MSLNFYLANLGTCSSDDVNLLTSCPESPDDYKNFRNVHKAEGS